MKKNNRGLTVIEIIIIMTLMGFAIPALLAAFSRTVLTGGDVKNTLVATNLAEEMMELKVTHDKFEDINSVAKTDLTGNFSRYNYQIVVDYVNANNLDSPVGYATDFKRVKTIITKDNVPGFNVTYETIVANIE